MRIEIRASGGPVCPSCGAHEVVFVPSANQHLEAELDEVIDRLIAGCGWWRLLAKRRLRQLKKFKDRVADELRQATVRV